MKCPNEECGTELHDEYAPFCDMCNCDIFRCVNPECPACGVLTTNNKYCSQCSEPVEPNGPAGNTQLPPNSQTPQPQQSTQPVALPAAQVPAGKSSSTEFMQAPGGRLVFRHTDGWIMELVDGDIIGRVNGRHVDKLGGTKVLSGTHAKITCAQNGWHITDQKSMNKTWVNGKEAEPFTPVPIKQNDVVILASLKFTVTII